MFRYHLDENFHNYLREEWDRRLHSMRISGIILGVVMILLGILCLVFPVESVYVVEVIASAALIAFGILQIVEYIRLPFAYMIGGMLVSGILNIILGIMLLTSPTDAMLITFSFMFGIDLMCLGITQLSFSSALRFASAESYGWVIAQGIINIFVSLMFFLMPLSSSFALGVIAAVYLIIAGAMLLGASLKLKNRG